MDRQRRGPQIPIKSNPWKIWRVFIAAVGRGAPSDLPAFPFVFFLPSDRRACVYLHWSYRVLKINTGRAVAAAAPGNKAV